MVTDLDILIFEAERLNTPELITLLDRVANIRLSREDFADVSKSTLPVSPDPVTVEVEIRAIEAPTVPIGARHVHQLGRRTLRDRCRFFQRITLALLAMIGYLSFLLVQAATVNTARIGAELDLYKESAHAR